MNLSFLEPGHWREFRLAHPDACAWLELANLLGEGEYLERIPSRNERQERRLNVIRERLDAHPVKVGGSHDDS